MLAKPTVTALGIPQGSVSGITIREEQCQSKVDIEHFARQYREVESALNRIASEV